MVTLYFIGTLRCVGGSSSSAIYAGAAGTVYKYESRRGPQYRELKYNQNITSFKPEHSKIKVDNEQHVVNTPTVIMEEDTVLYEFDEMQVTLESYCSFRLFLRFARLICLQCFFRSRDTPL